MDNSLEKAPEGSDWQESAELFERLSTIIKTVSRKPNIEVVKNLSLQDQTRLLAEGNNPETTWFRSTQHDPKTRKVVREFIYVPPEMTTIPENEAKGKAAHEAGHTAITRYGEFVPEDVARELGFSGMLAALEERPTDEWVRKTYPGAGDWLDEARIASLREGNEDRDTREALSNIPKFLQFCNSIVYGRWLDQLSNLDSEVRGLYEELALEIEDIEQTLPDLDASESERVEQAKERYKKAYLRIWPKVKALAQQDLKDQQLDETLSQALENMSDNSQGESMSDQIQQALEQMMNQSVDSSQENDQQTSEEQESESDIDSEDLQALAKAIAEGLQNQSKDLDGEKGEPQMLQGGAKKLPPELQSILQRIFDSLPEDVQEAIKEMAKQTLEGKEDELLQSLQSELNEETNLPTHEEHEAEHQAEKGLEAKKREQDMVKQVSQEVATVSASMQQNKSVYEQTYQVIHSLEETLYQTLDEILHPNRKTKTVLKSSGSRINLPAVYQRASQIGAGSSNVESKIFESIHRPDRKDYAITLLVDLSGSMRDQKIQETFKGVVLLTEVLSRLGVQIEVLGFQDDVIEFKDFSTPMADDIRQRMSGMVAEVSGTNPSGHNQPSYNDDAPCLKEACNRIKKRKEKEKFIFVLSDGIPEGHSSTESDLIEAIEEIKSTEDISLVGIGLGRGTGHVKHFYGQTALPNINIAELPEVLGGLLTDIILHPHKFRS
jgi:nitric oxide reductase activation protein